MEKEHDFTLNIGIPNGIILTIIGILVLLTPVVHDMILSHILIDVAAGLILIGGGVLSLYNGIKSEKKIND